MKNNCCSEIKVINYKSDFKLIEEPVKGFSITNAPFKFTYYIRPSRSYIASYDGKVFNNCTITDDGKLIVAFDNHNLGVGRLKVKREFYLNDPQYNSGICDLVTEEELDLILDKNIKSDYVEITSTIYPYYHLSGLGNSEDFENNEEGNLVISQKFKDSKQDTLISGTNIKTINGESLLGAGNIVINGSGSGVSEISGLINLKDPERVKEVQLSLADKQYKTFIVTDSNGNYPSPLVSTVYLDDMNGLMDLFYRGNDLALRHILNNGEAYYKYLGMWSSENIRKYVKLPQFNLQTVKVGDLVTIMRHDFTSDEFYSKYIDFNSIVIDNSAFQTAKILAGFGSKSDGEYIKHMMLSGNIYSAESDPNNSSVTAYPLSIDGKVQFYTAQITPNTQKIYSGEFWTGNMTGPGIYSYVNNVEPNPGTDVGEVFTGYVSPNGAQTLISMKNPSKVFTRPNLNSSWSLGGVQKIINDDLYRTKYGYNNKANTCLKTGVNNYFSDTIGGITGNWSLFVTCSYDGDPNYYHLLQTAVGRDANNNLGKIFQRMGWYRGNGEDLNFTEWIGILTKTSELTNDSGFVTSEELATAISQSITNALNTEV